MYDSYSIKSKENRGFYYKVVTTETETDIYFVGGDGKGGILGALQLYRGKPMRSFEVVDWLGVFLKCRFFELSCADIERDKI